jgi:DNA-3-methyladenine glycosylase II
MEYVKHLSKDKKLKKLIADQPPFSLKKRKNIFTYLCASIISQQLSTKVASVINQRFADLFKKEPTAEQLLTIPFEDLRAIGLSNAKANYVQNVARFELEFGLKTALLNKMDNEEVIQYLTQIKGVGRWTAEMLLMFALGREDVFAIDDLGIRNAMIGLYELDTADKKALNNNLLSISASWSPYRTYACLHLWQWKDK